MATQAEQMFETLKESSKIYGTMLLTELLQEANGDDTTATKEANAQYLNLIKRQIALAVKLRDK